MTVTIKPAVFRDASYVTANLRPADHHEAFCQLADGVTTVELAWWLLHAGAAFVAYDNEQPVALFGTAPMTPFCYSLFAVGTPAMRRAVPAISRFLMREHVEQRIAAGALTMEARSLATHTEAHRWMLSLGAEQQGEPFPYGKAGELFVMFRWTVAGYRAIREKRWSE